MKAALFLLALMCTEATGQLYTSGPKLVSESGKHVPLKCVNWYGAHQELFVVGGIEQRRPSAIVNEIVSMGSNCVRLVFSIDLWKKNPPPPALLKTSECAKNQTSMDIFDCVVEKLTDAGIMVILNNHNSFPGWIGLIDVQQGLWNLPGYSVYTWLDCLEHMSARYKNNPLVIGMDIRNEIHDQDGVYITWGKSNDITTDWKAAASIASDRIEKVNPNMLVVVSGLCYGYDFADMMLDIGPSSAFARKKLVYTSHVYTSAFWWTHIEWGWVWVFAVLFFLFGAILSARQYLKLGHVNWILYTIASAWPFAIAWIVAFAIYYFVFASIGCNAYAKTMLPIIYFMVGLIGVSIVACVMLEVFTDTDSERTWCFVVGIWCCIHALVLVAIAIVSQTQWMIELELSKWDEQPVPLWVGEFGAMWNNDSPVWNQLVAFILHRDLDFAYWPLNGLKWSQDLHEYTDESFGLLTQNYNAIRNPKLVSTLFAHTTAQELK
jgi:hypothetical protein